MQRGPVVDIKVRCDSNMRRKVQQGLQVSKCSGTDVGAHIPRQALIKDSRDDTAMYDPIVATQRTTEMQDS